MFKRLAYAHSVLWRGDALYRRAWYTAPQIIAIVLATWLLVPRTDTVSPLPSPPSANSTSPWAPIESDEDVGNAVDALRYQAQTNADALTRLRTLADAGNPYAQFDMAFLSDPANGRYSTIASNVGVAESYYGAASKQGNLQATAYLGSMIAFGRGQIAPDPKTGMPILLQAANANNAAAQFSLGLLARQGLGAPKDEAAAQQWFRRAADNGLAAAQTQVGVAYMLGTPPTKRDLVTGLKWLEAAARDPGQSEAARDVGVAYLNGDGVAKDMALANQWFTKAAGEGNATAQQYLNDQKQAAQQAKP